MPRRIMKAAVDRLYTFLVLKERDPKGYDGLMNSESNARLHWMTRLSRRSFDAPPIHSQWVEGASPSGSILFKELSTNQARTEQLQKLRKSPNWHMPASSVRHTMTVNGAVDARFLGMHGPEFLGCKKVATRPVGRMFAQPTDLCDCDSRVLELYTCRSCGTAYARLAAGPRQTCRRHFACRSALGERSTLIQ